MSKKVQVVFQNFQKAYFLEFCSNSNELKGKKKQQRLDSGGIWKGQVDESFKNPCTSFIEENLEESFNREGIKRNFEEFEQSTTSINYFKIQYIILCG